MNFEARVSNINQLIKWLYYLKNKIHEVVAGSVIIWYDSVITDGNVRWQSQLNHLNRVKIFNYLLKFQINRYFMRRRTCFFQIIIGI